MSTTILWLIGAFAVLGAEMLIGTIYLLTVSAALLKRALLKTFVLMKEIKSLSIKSTLTDLPLLITAAQNGWLEQRQDSCKAEFISLPKLTATNWF